MSPPERAAGDGLPTSDPCSRDGWRLAIQAGRADEMRAEIAVVVRRAVAAAAALRLSGTLTGPIRGRDVTLPTTVRLAAMPEASRPDLAAARAVFTEPAYWSPELPNLYRLSADVREEGDDAVIMTCERLVGLRRLGVRGRSFWLEGRRWVPRGVACSATDFAAAAFRVAHAAAVIEDPAEEICAAADRAGVAIIAQLAAGTSAEAAAAAVARWALHPSVVLVVVPRAALAVDGGAPVEMVRPRHSTLLVAATVDGLAPPTAVPRSVDCLLVELPEAGLPHAAWRSVGPGVPLVARRTSPPVSGEGADSVSALRLACDRLQADLAGWACATGAAGLGWDWAGFVATRSPAGAARCGS